MTFLNGRKSDISIWWTQVKSLGSALGESFGPGNGGQIVALSILTYGTIEGFLFGYLATRIYLTNVFERSDPKA